ncbi:DNA repair exonuclease SbcCD, C subunit, putative [Citrifermentans bemidjiense Bem]|uniref:DNA repair exonuclease SbcCD, C subunit, putative n=1 Tax=Citrifermentans bemidjiense (strain ATCC BAA-1014 / DSM 16622 / JCM 12645 / Bem) TaxID=404380 RepID=B5EF04_CITBB|nr:SMC family ATPase [Citrifermentans bemidjiense]ACH39313.1 DNA repair exonuclease SbcCD, C subunit, putative [Citrifermentans bemidjiense Bem]
MRIISVQLKNIKSHRDKEIAFSPGINVLSGANGSGKSTIFEAIGYALFGVSAQDFVSKADRFLTIGAKKGEISVVFEPASGETYRVTRTVGGAGKWLLAKDNGCGFEIEEHANIQETEQRIASLLGLATGRPLAEQFKLVIGPFQNDFLGPFVIKQPTKRQDAFDEILGIDTWRKTFDGTKSLASAIIAKTETIQAEVAAKMEQVSVLPAKEQELRDLREQGVAKEAQLRQKLAEQEQVNQLFAGLEARKERIDAVGREVQALEDRSVSGKEYISTQLLLVEQSKTAAALVAEAAQGKHAYDAAEAKLKRLRDEEQQKLALERKLGELDKEQAALQSTLAIENRELAETRATMDTERERLALEKAALADALIELKSAEAATGEALAVVNRSCAQFRELPVHRIDQALPYLFVALDRMAAIDEQSLERKKLISAGAALKTEAAELVARQALLEKVQAERSELAGRRLSLVEGQEKLGAGDCPFFHEPCRNLASGDASGVFEARIQRIDAEISRLDQQAVELAAQVAAAQAAARELAGVEQVASELEKAGRERQKLEQDFTNGFSEIAPALLVPSLRTWLDSAELGIDLAAELPGLQVELAAAPLQQRAALSEASDAWRRVVVLIEEGLDARLKKAQEPVQECALKLVQLAEKGESLAAKERELAAYAEKLAFRERAIAEHGKRLAALVEAIGAVKKDLAIHAGLDQAIKEAGEELVRFQADRDRYIANEKAAQELEKRQETLAKYQAKLKEIEGSLAAKREELRQSVEGYDQAQHEAVKQQQVELVSAVATLTSEIGAVGEGISRLEGETAALREIAAEIEKKLSAIEALKEQGILVKFLRNQVFKNVSTQLSERFREEISFRADRIYRSICASDEELVWGENYQVVLKDMAEGQVRERSDDQLSGGQMMSAVVALRLALLQTIGARIAFFDEPTSNLDAERRENLARAFRAIDVGQEEVTEHWYDQLFLVSHDVSFTEITDQTIQLD